MQPIELRRCIYNRFASEAEFSRSLGWTRQRLHKITSGQKKPSLQEAYDIASVLSISIDRVACFFIPQKSPNEQPIKED